MEKEISLQILQILEKRPELTQRQLAIELEVSLGKINYCLRALKEKGWVKVQNFSKSKQKIQYIHFLTPAGIESKIDLTLQFLELKKIEYEVLKQEIEKLEIDTMNLTQSKNINPLY